MNALGLILKRGSGFQPGVTISQGFRDYLEDCRPEFDNLEKQSMLITGVSKKSPRSFRRNGCCVALHD